MNILGSILAGGVKETLEGIGGLAKDIRVAITGKDPVKMAEIESKLVELEFVSMKAQTDINQEEAKSSSLFVSGWRPFIGWVCGSALAVYYIPKAMVATIFWCYAAYVTFSAWQAGQPIPELPAFPEIGMAEVIGLLLSLLGIGGLRTLEKKWGVARS